MPTILLKKSDTPGSVPGTANLTNLAGGVEVAVNTADKRVYSMTSASAVIELGTNPSSLTCSDVSATVLRAGSATITNLLATTLTVSGGTANGVLYLNGSKVATSGSALTFDGTTVLTTPRINVTNTGTGATFSSSGGSGMRLYGSSGTNQWDIYLNGANVRFSDNTGGGVVKIDTGAVIDGNLGIGTASPQGKLTVKTGTNENLTVLTGGSGDMRISALNDAASATVQLSIQASPLYFRGTGGTINATIDSSGNLGLGVTPSNWQSSSGASWDVIDIGGAGALAFSPAGSNDLTLAANAFYDNTDSRWEYKNTGDKAARYSVTAGGTHAWYVTNSTGSANTLISFTQAMTLDASSNLSVGTTTNRGRITTSGSGDQTIYFTHNDNTPGRTVTLRLGNNDATYHTSSAFIRATQGPGIDFYNLSFGTSSGGAAQELMTLTGSGNLGLGTLSPTQTLEAVGGIATTGTSAFFAQRALVPSGLDIGAPPLSWRFYTTGTTYTTGAMIQGLSAGAWSSTSAPMDMRFYTVPSSSTTLVERGRFTAGGYFKASDNGSYNSGSTSLAHEFNQSADNNSLIVYGTNATLSTSGVMFLQANRNTTNNSFYAFSYYNGGAAAYKLRIADSGDVTNTNGTYAAISDIKLKEDVVDAASQWDDIKNLRVRKYRLKSEPDKMQIGLVAQEAETVSPGLVDEHIDRDAEGNDLGTTTKSVKYSILYMKAVKALQEAMARIEQLEADMAALKASA